MHADGCTDSDPQPTARGRGAPRTEIGAVGQVLLLLTVVSAVLVVQGADPRWRATGLLGLQVFPCAAVVRGILRYRPQHSMMWWCLAVYYAATAVPTFESVVAAWSTGSTSFFDRTVLELVLGTLSSLAAMAATVCLLVVRRRDAAGWAVSDALVIGAGLLAAFLLITLLPLYGRVGFSTAFWNLGIVYGIRDLSMAVVAVVVIYSEQLRRGPVTVIVGVFIVWGVVELVWLQIGASAPENLLSTVLLSLLVSCTIACTAVAIGPSMRNVVMPSDSPRPSWTLGRTIALAAGIGAPLVAFWVEPPATTGQLAAFLIAMGVLVVVVVVRMRVAVLQAHRLLSEVRILAEHDHLTGLPNRRYLYGTFLRRLTDRARNGEVVVLVVTYLDLDNLREVNDQLDHTGGDHLLCVVADALLGTCTGERQVVRVGGDEFVVLTVPEVDSDPELAAAESETAVLQALQALKDAGHDSSASVGTTWGRLAGAAGDEVEPRLDHLLQDADLAQAEAKRAGGGRGMLFDSAMGERSRARALLRRELPRAWGSGQMTLAYQSVVDLETGGIFGVESLLRWTHPVLGPVAPPDAIDTAIRLGLIGELGVRILERAQRDISDPAFPDEIRVGVNVAAHQLRPAAIDSLVAAVQQGGLAGRVWLEITEQALVQEQRYVAGALADLRSAGVMVAIDDFGSGYCGLDYLCSLPIDLIKLDMQFALHVADPVRRRVSQTVAQLADALGADIIAEGIDCWSTAETMRDLGCRYGQGFGLRRPHPSIRHALEPVHRGTG